MQIEDADHRDMSKADKTDQADKTGNGDAEQPLKQVFEDHKAIATPHWSGRGVEDDPDSFMSYEPTPSDNPELEALFAAPAEGEDDAVLTQELDDVLDAAADLTDADAKDKAGSSALDHLFEDDLDEEAELDQDPMMHALESVLSAGDEDVAQFEAGIEEELDEEAELDADPFMSELEALLADAPEEPEDAAPSAPNPLDEDFEALFASDLEEEADLDADPVMSELEEMIDDSIESDLEELLSAVVEPMPTAVLTPAPSSAPSSDPDEALASVAMPDDDDILFDDDDEDFEWGPEEDLADLWEDGVRDLSAEPDRAANIAPPERSSEDDAALEAVLNDDTRKAAPELLPATVASRALATKADGISGVKGRAVQTKKASPPARRRGGADLDQVLNRTTRSRAPRNRWRGLMIWAVIFAVLGYIAFLPYDFGVGGEFTVQPGEISQVRARTDGEITQISVREGDWVNAGDVLAVLSNWDEKRDIAVREAEIERLEAELDTLMAGARPEEIALKEKELSSAELRVQFARDDLARTERLFEAGTIAKKTVDDKQEAVQLAESVRDEAQVALDLIKSGARESEIAAARAEISRNQQELDFARLLLEQTFVRAGSPGQVVSSLSSVPVGAYLPEGGLFAELEDNRVVFAEIEVPETEIEEVIIGAEVELKLWSDSATSITGIVARIAPKAEEREFGKVLRVTVRVQNEDGKLASGMTGYAKVAAEERPVWEAFSRVIVRFFQVELWSWLP